MKQGQSSLEILTNNKAALAPVQHFAIAQGKQVLEGSRPIKPVSELIVDYIKEQFKEKFHNAANQ